MTEFFLPIAYRGRPAEDEQEAATRFHVFWALTLGQTTQSREAKKNHITCCLEVNVEKLREAWNNAMPWSNLVADQRR